MKGLEPSTFCMASRRSSQLSYIRASPEYSPAVRSGATGRACRYRRLMLGAVMSLVALAVPILDPLPTTLQHHQQHPQRHLDDRRVSLDKTARERGEDVLGRDAAGAMRLANLPLAGLPRERVPFDRRAAAGAGDRRAACRYCNSGVVKPGQADAGSGTTPTLMHGGHVAITDNADPMNVVVYRKRPVHRLSRAGLRPGRERDRELADGLQGLAVRREQLRLRGPVRAAPAR